MKTPTRLWNRDFFLLWQGQLVSQIGSKAFLVGMMLWVQQSTGSPLLVGALMTVATLPAVIVGPLAGAMADRYSRRVIIVGADIISGLGSLLVASLFFSAAEATELLVVVLFVVALVNSLARSFFRPSVAAAVPDLVPRQKITAANGLRQSASRISAVLGQGSGGMVYSVFGAPFLFLVDGLSYLFSAVSECFIRIPAHRSTEKSSDVGTFQRVWEDSKQGLRYVWKHVGMRNLLLIEATANFFLMPMVVLLPFYVSINLQQGASWYGWLLAGMSGGGIIGFALAGALPLAGRVRASVVLLACLGGELLMGALALIENPRLALANLVMVGVLVGLFNVQALSTFQTAASSEYRGRVMGLLGTISMGAAPLGMLLGGIAGDVTGKNISLVYAWGSGLAIVFTLLLGLRGPVLSFLGINPDASRETWDAEISPASGALPKSLGGDI